jgi:hypothetical protein
MHSLRSLLATFAALALAGAPPYIVSTRFALRELDALVKAAR